MSTTTASPALAENHRDLDWPTLRRQLGWTFLGRPQREQGGALVFSQGYGHEVRITLDASDTYNVEHVFTRGTKRTVKGVVRGVYCDEVAEVAYRASCWRDGKFGS